MAMFHANYCITYANIGTQGRIWDGGVFNNCSLALKVNSCTLNLPSEEPFSNKRIKRIPYVIVADNAFAMKKNIIIPYSGYKNMVRNTRERIFSYRLSIARSGIENTFGILSSIFRVFRKPILLHPDEACIIIEYCVLLHNFLRRSRESRVTYTPGGTFDTVIDEEHIKNGNWRNHPNELTSS